MNIIKQILLKPFINIAALERQIGCKQSTVSNWLKGHRETISPKWIWAIVRELSQTGFVIEDWVIFYDDEMHDFVCKKDMDKPADVIEHRKKPTGEVYSVENTTDEDPDPDYTSSWFEYRQSQSRVTISSARGLIDFLGSLEKEFNH
jgi:hypothetical protein